MALHRRLTPTVATVTFLFATALHLRSVLLPAVADDATLSDPPLSGSLAFDSLTVVLPAVAMGAAFVAGWISRETAPNTISEWVKVTVIGVVSGWFAGFVGVGVVLSTLGYPTVYIVGVDGILQNAVAQFFTGGLPFIFAALAGIALGQLHRQTPAKTSAGTTTSYYRVIALPIGIVSILLALLDWIRHTLVPEVTGLFVPWYATVGYALLSMFVPILTMGGAFLIGWLAINRSTIDDDYGRWFGAAAIGSIGGWFVGFVGIGVLFAAETGNQMEAQILLYSAGLAVSFQVLPLIFAVIAGLAIGRIRKSGMSHTSTDSSHSSRSIQ